MFTYIAKRQVLGADLSPGYVLCWLVMYPELKGLQSYFLLQKLPLCVLFCFFLTCVSMSKGVYNSKEDSSVVQS